jgi:MFS family permease
MSPAFRSLRHVNYRIWAAGAIVSNIGTWMQRTAQDWIVLAVLTRHSASAVGIVVGLQFGPQLLMLPLSGFAADYFDRRRLLIVTQASMGGCALGLGLLTVTGLVQIWHVYVFAFLLGSAAAFDAPARQTFVSELVPQSDLPNAVGLNSTSFNAARMIGPAIAGMMIARIGTGWVFLFNAASFVAVICSLVFMRVEELHSRNKGVRTPGGLVEGFRYVWRRPDLMSMMLMVCLIGTFGFNFPIYISTMSVSVFHVGAREFGLLTSVMAIGSVTGAFLSARRGRPSMSYLLGGATVFALGLAAAAMMPDYWLFGTVLVVIGVAAQTFSTSLNATVQLSTEAAMRGRVMAILLAVALGGAPVGGPVIGWIADTSGPRWAMGFGAATALAGVMIGLRYVLIQRRTAGPAA